METKDFSSLKVVELKEHLEKLGLPTNGLKADLVERLKKHYESAGSAAGNASPTQNQTNASPKRIPADASPKNAPVAAPVHSSVNHHGDASPKVAAASPKKVSAAEPLPSAALSPKSGKASSPRNRADEDNGDESKPSAAELARRRAERFGIPVQPDEKPDEKMTDDTPGDSKTPKGSSPGDMEKYRDLFATPEGSILTTEDFLSDGRSAHLVALVIESFGEDKVKEVINDILAKASKDFENDRSKIQSAPRLASFRLSRALKSVLPRQETAGRVKKTIEKDSHKKEDWKKKWTDEEWAEWKKNKGGNQKKDWNDWKKGGGEWKSNDWNNKGGKKWDSKKRSDSYDTFESDVEEFIYSNKLDKRSSEALRTESKGMVGYVMDQGFNLSRYNNPSKEVMMRMKEYVNKKRGYGNNRGGAGGRDYPQKSRSRSRSGGRQEQRSASRGRSRSRSDSRDQYRRSRSQSM